MKKFITNLFSAKRKTVIIAVFAILCQGALWGNLEYNLIIGLSAVFLSLALALFLCEYLLYRYDHDDQFEEPFEEQDS